MCTIPVAVKIMLALASTFFNTWANQKVNKKNPPGAGDLEMMKTSPCQAIELSAAGAKQPLEANSDLGVEGA